MNRKQLLTTCLVIMSAFAGNVTADNNDNVAVNVDLVFDEIQLVAIDDKGDSYTVYSSEVFEGAETVEIPSGFAGEYEIRPCRGGYYFYGDIVI